MDECVSYLAETQRRSARNRNSRTQKNWRNFSFFTELKKQDGQDYEPNSLCSMQASIDIYLCEHGYMHSVFKAKEFASSKAVLECIWITAQ